MKHVIARMSLVGMLASLVLLTSVVSAQTKGPANDAAKKLDSSEPLSPSDQPQRDPTDEPVEAAESAPPESTSSLDSDARRKLLLASLTIFVLAVFVGFEVITKVPPTLHTPLMSGSNAISGITIVGALIVAGDGAGMASFWGFLAVVLATVNVVGGFLVTHRMLSMFKRR
jgi:NAD(P) transhydrogenase subunit alpha